MTLWAQATRDLAKADPVLGALIKKVGPCPLKKQRGEPYAALLRAIAHQQLHGKAAETIFNRFLALYDGALPTPAEVLATSVEQLRACGFSQAKALALLDVAAKTEAGIVPTRRQAARLDNEELIKRMSAVRGVGRWTVEMFLMFTLAKPDVLPVDDFGIREGFKVLYKKKEQPKPKELAAYGARWAPWRTVASWYLWRALELSRVKR